MSTTSTATAFDRVALELRETREAEARHAREQVEVVASMGRGIPTVTGRNLREVKFKLIAEGYRPDKAEALPRNRLCVPHKDGYRKAIVRVRVKRGL